MNLQDIVEPMSTNQLQHSQGSRVSRGQTWDYCKDEIYRVYMLEKNTLPKTMELFEREYGLKAWFVEIPPTRRTFEVLGGCVRRSADYETSKRTWKAKLKEWKFEKYLTDKEKNIIIAKVEKRRRDGKETVVFYQNRQVSPARLTNFKRRKGQNGVDVLSPSAATPEDLMYHTPSIEEDPSRDGDHDQGVLDPPHTPSSIKQTDTLSVLHPITSFSLQSRSRTSDTFESHSTDLADTIEVMTIPPVEAVQLDIESVEKWAMREKKTMEISEIADLWRRNAEYARISEMNLSKERANEAALASYKASLAMFRTVNNDTNLFLAARSAGLVRISVNWLDAELLRFDVSGDPRNRPFGGFGRSAINTWCGGC